ncbi:MAG: DapH/DapD/GlmU-related protein [Phascolarctobacterium sp.]|nr:DapH/DapD/GlmU-related protein [Phascolarctobacterium sp.]
MFSLMYCFSRKNRLLNMIFRILYHCDIPMESRIAKSVKFNHGALGVVIHPKTIIDDNVWIEHHVCCGQRIGILSEAPHIEKDCVIGAYAILLGGITIGEGSVIGAGCIVTHDIPPIQLFTIN